MPTITATPYSHEIYHSVTNPSLHSAITLFQTKNAMQHINTTIRSCFLSHGVEKHFTACILHRHFDLSETERNIEEADGRALASSDFTDIRACSWLFYQGGMYPYEFKRGGVEGGVMVPPTGFVDEFRGILEENGLEGVIGLQVYKEGVVGMERTDHERRVSTTRSYPEGAAEVKEPSNAVVASFAFF
ncbi:hypothetical protein BDW59DRAFT_36012 [Aspergillus cavernicola]|uniref:Uncharacterized protein n=1 Tax=Aspergillus cavernicola TaxID=176166 RepID=A0ABR4IQE8_9EURO